MITRTIAALLCLAGGTACAAPEDDYYCGQADYLLADANHLGKSYVGYGADVCVGARRPRALGYELHFFHDVFQRPRNEQKRTGATLDLTYPFRVLGLEPYVRAGLGGEETGLKRGPRIKMVYDAGAGVAWGKFTPWDLRLRFDLVDSYQRIDGFDLHFIYVKLGVEVPIGDASR